MIARRVSKIKPDDKLLLLWKVPFMDIECLGFFYMLKMWWLHAVMSRVYEWQWQREKKRKSKVN